MLRLRSFHGLRYRCRWSVPGAWLLALAEVAFCISGDRLADVGESYEVCGDLVLADSLHVLYALFLMFTKVIVSSRTSFNTSFYKRWCVVVVSIC